jgi:chaperonin GroEL (HSP60 family)
LDIIFFLIYFSYRIEVREVGGRKVIVFSQQQDEDTTVATIIIRASTEHVLNDVEVRPPPIFT